MPKHYTATPLRPAPGGKLLYSLDDAKTSVRLADAVDRLDVGARPGNLYAIWEHPDGPRPNPAEAAQHAAMLTPDSVMVQLADGELLLLDPQYRYRVTTA